MTEIEKDAFIIMIMNKNRELGHKIIDLERDISTLKLKSNSSTQEMFMMNRKNKSLNDEVDDLEHDAYMNSWSVVWLSF